MKDPVLIPALVVKIHMPTSSLRMCLQSNERSRD